MAFCFIMSLQANSQIVNIERNRLSEDSAGWQGQANFSFFQRKNTNVLTLINNNVQAQYRKKRNILLLLNNIGFIFFKNSNYEDISAFQHIRYTRELDSSNTWAWEVFAQSQTDRILLIGSRYLLGTGPRLHMLKKEKINLTTGLITMYEYDRERSASDAFFSYTGRINRDIRLSYYLSYSIKPWDWLSWSSTFYYQPVVYQFSDYRISAISSLNFKVKEWLSLGFALNWNYDAEPSQDLGINEFYQTSNSLTFTF